jgi:UPF0716 protein FxsA
MRWLFLLFIVMPVVELVILLKLGAWLGVWPTVGLILGTAFIGVNLLRQQGLKTLTRANERMATGEMPAKEMIEGIVLAVGGALLLTPGLVTDVIGFSCLLPGTRQMYIALGMKRVKVMATQSVYMHSSQMHGADPMSGFRGQGPTAGSSAGQRPDVHVDRNGIIEGQFERKD